MIVLVMKRRMLVIKTDWVIIKEKSVQGTVEYSVSDGAVGERTFSYNFKTLKEATAKLRGLEDSSKFIKE